MRSPKTGTGGWRAKGAGDARRNKLGRPAASDCVVRSLATGAVLRIEPADEDAVIRPGGTAYGYPGSRPGMSRLRHLAGASAPGVPR